MNDRTYNERGFDAIVGKTIDRVETTCDNVAEIYFTDGSHFQINGDEQCCVSSYGAGIPVIACIPGVSNV